MKREIKGILVFLPIIIVLSFLVIIADKTGKLGVFGTLITLLINTDNYELNYNEEVSRKLKLKINYIKNMLLCFFCSCYITYIVNELIRDEPIKSFTVWILPGTFFIIIWLYTRVVIPKIIHHFNHKEG
ncbi:hypothetical protein [Enterococcus sp. AZ126]|uniref:hypothetical protein n=1 Tax=Enterococcus sp. AZ126 TaxID=2774635 RepID=UPI003F296A66